MSKTHGSDAIKQVRNLLRPYFNNRRPPSRWKPFNAIRRTVPADQLQRLFEVTENQRFYSFPGLGNTFPTNRKRIPDGTLRLLEPAPLRRELNLEIGRLNHHKEKLLRAIGALAAINQALLKQDHARAEPLIVQFEEDFGYSILFAKKKLLCTFLSRGLPGLLRESKALIGEGQGHGWGALCKLVYDMADPAIHPSKSAKEWLRPALRLPTESGWYRLVYCWEILSFPLSDLAELVLRYSGVSLLDLAYLINGLSALDREFEDLVEQRLDPDLRQALTSFNDVELINPARYSGPGKTTLDAGMYRTSFFFSEYRNVIRWRAELAGAAFTRELAGFGSSSVKSPLTAAAMLLRDGKDPEAALPDLAAWMGTVTGTSVASGDLGLSRSVIIAELLRLLGPEDVRDDNYLVGLLARSDDLQDYVVRGSFDRLLSDDFAENFPLLNFFLRDLIFKNSRTPDNDLERRTAFMDLYLAKRVKSVGELLEQIAASDISIAHYVARTCSRSFLERLFLLMSSVKDVLECRIAVCGWLSANGFGDSSLDEEGSALNRELENLDTRSDIDSTRVHVDEEALREWFVDTQYASVARYIQTVIAEGPSSAHGTVLAFYKEEKKRERGSTDGDDPHVREGHIGAEFILLDIVERTLETFVTDRSFGLDSYLSRRIRHGTLSGFLMAPIGRSIHKLEDAATDPERPARTDQTAEIAELITCWKDDLSQELDRARRQLLQVRDEDHPDGLIMPTWRTAANVSHLDAMISRVRERVLAAAGTYDIFPDVHALCWDLIETDLGRIRQFLVVDFLKPQVEKLNRLFRELSFDERAFAAPFLSEIIQTLNSRVHEIRGWFIRPVFRRDSYDLRNLVDSTISIVRELQESYDLTEEIRVPPNLQISRSLFEWIGDILYILLGNAAKHAPPASTIIVEASAEHKDLLVIRVRSSTASNADFDQHYERIQQACTVSEGELNEAAVAEGFSGIRKIIGLLRRFRRGDAALLVVPDRNELCFDFTITLPVVLGRQ